MHRCIESYCADVEKYSTVQSVLLPVVASHSIILVNRVQAMFTCGLRETRGGEVHLRDTPAQSLELLLNYMYRAELYLSDDNIQGVAAAAFLLHVDGAFRLEKRLASEMLIIQ